MSLASIAVFHWDLVELENSPLNSSQHKPLRFGWSCATFSVGKIRSFPKLVSQLDYIWKIFCAPSTNWTLPSDIPMSPDVTRAKKEQNPKLLLGRHVPIPHASDTVVGLLLGWVGNDVLAGYCKATHGCCMGACRKYFFGRMFRVTWDIREQTMFPCEQANATIHPCLYKVYQGVCQFLHA